MQEHNPTREEAAREFAQSLYDHKVEHGAWQRRSWTYNAILDGDAWDLSFAISDDECFSPDATNLAIAEAIIEAVASC